MLARERGRDDAAGDGRGDGAAIAGIFNDDRDGNAWGVCRCERNEPCVRSSI
jgi:hypothetical protein